MKMNPLLLFFSVAAIVNTPLIAGDELEAARRVSESTGWTFTAADKGPAGILFSFTNSMGWTTSTYHPSKIIEQMAAKGTPNITHGGLYWPEAEMDAARTVARKTGWRMTHESVYRGSKYNFLFVDTSGWTTSTHHPTKIVEQMAAKGTPNITHGGLYWPEAEMDAARTVARKTGWRMTHESVYRGSKYNFLFVDTSGWRTSTHHPTKIVEQMAAKGTPNITHGGLYWPEAEMDAARTVARKTGWRMTHESVYRGSKYNFLFVDTSGWTTSTHHPSEIVEQMAAKGTPNITHGGLYWPEAEMDAAREVARKTGWRMTHESVYRGSKYNFLFVDTSGWTTSTHHPTKIVEQMAAKGTPNITHGGLYWPEAEMDAAREVARKTGWRMTYGSVYGGRETRFTFVAADGSERKTTKAVDLRETIMSGRIADPGLSLPGGGGGCAGSLGRL